MMALRAGSSATSPEPERKPAGARSGRDVTAYRVFIASPGDVDEVRDAVPGVLAKLNGTLGKSKAVRFEAWDWRHDARRGLGDIQADLINPELAHADVVVAIFHNRLGTPTSVAPSGSAEEVLRAIDGFEKSGRPHVLFYFRKKAVDLDTEEAALQKAALINFKKQLPKRLDRSFVEVADFENGLYKDLYDWFETLPPVTGTSSAAPSAPHPSGSGNAAKSSTSRAAPAATFDAQRYLDYVDTTYGHVVLTGILADKATPSLSLREIYVPLRASGPNDDAALVRGPRESVEMTEGRSRKESATVESAFKKRRCLLIEGQPGSGKTTVLHRLAIALIDAHRGKPEAARSAGFATPFPFPVVVPLRKFRAWLTDHPGPAPSCERLIAFLEQQYEPAGAGAGWVRDKLRKGELALFLDGLDEIPDLNLRKETASIVRDFAKVEEWRSCKFAVSSRSGGLEHGVLESFGKDNLTRVVVQPLNDAERAALVRQWHAAMVKDPVDAERRSKDLLERISKNRDVAKLADTPILLTAIAVVHFTTGGLPDRRAELYERCVSSMLHNWNMAKDAEGQELCGPVPLDVKFEIFEEVAETTHVQGGDARAIQFPRIVDVVRRRLRDASFLDKPILDFPAFVGELIPRTGLLIPGGDNDFLFRHLTFQEFLVARRACAQTPTATSYLAPRLEDPWWREVVALALGYQAFQSKPRAAALADELLLRALERADESARIAALATVCRGLLDLQSYRLPPPSVSAVLDRVSTEARKIVEDERRPGSVPDRAVIGRILGAFGRRDPRLTDEMRWVEVRPQNGQPFWIHRWPVTVGEFTDFLTDQGSYALERWKARPGGLQFDGPSNLPVAWVDETDAEAYCVWATKQPENRGFRVKLPTEPEWETAARAGRAGSRKQASRDSSDDYPWGDDFDATFANTHEAGVQDVSPVGLFSGKHSALGVWDMAGNVWEWTAGEEKESAVRLRAFRGGSFGFVARRARVSFRFWLAPGARDSDLGFRPLRVAAE